MEQADHRLTGDRLPTRNDAGARAVPGITDLRRFFAGVGLTSDRLSARDRGDKDLNPSLAVAADLKAAAVLVPLVAHEEGVSILLTQRTDHLSSHAGQIAFPGGRIEKHEDALAAALRETEEEIGLSSSQVEPLGSLDRYVTRTGYVIAPIVGIVHPPFTLQLHAHEVADAFEVPLAFILDPANREIHVREFQGVARKFFVYPYRDRMIWGATAGILTNLVDLLGARGSA